MDNVVYDVDAKQAQPDVQATQAHPDAEDPQEIQQEDDLAQTVPDANADANIELDEDDEDA